MRTCITTAFLLVLVAVPASAGEQSGRAGPPGGNVLERTLGPNEILRIFDADYLPEVRSCWEDFAARQRTATGKLTLDLVIRPGGTALLIDVRAPGVRGTRLQACIREFADRWTFPDRSGYTNVQIPVTLLKTRAPGAGPTRR